MVSRLWTRFSDSDCKGPRTGNDNKFPRKSSRSLELVVVSKTTVLEQPSRASSSYPLPTRNTWNEGRSTFKWKCTRKNGHKRVSGVCWSGGCWILLANDQLDVDGVLRPGIDTPFSPTAFGVLEMAGSTESPILLEKEEEKENSLPPPTTTPVSERPTRPPELLSSRPFVTGIENVPEYVYRTLFE